MSLPTASPGDRLQRLGVTSARRKPEGGPRELTARHKLLVIYQLDGCPHRDLLEPHKTRQKAVINEETGQPEIRMVAPEPGQPLSLEEAADVLRIRRRNARQLTKTKAYSDFMAAELQNFRDGERARSLHTMVEIRDDPGLGKAADRKVRLTASQMLLGEGEGSRAGVNVNVNPSSRQLTAGIVIVLPSGSKHAPNSAHMVVEHEDSK